MRDFVEVIKDPIRRIRRIFNIIKLDCRVKRIKKRVYQKVERKEKIRVAFCVQYPEMWNSVKNVYDQMARDSNFDVFILTFPKRIGVNLEKPQFFERNEAWEFFATNSIECIRAYDQGKWYDISKISPDIIFVQRTYDEYLPQSFSLNTLSRQALLAYIPYSYQFGPGIHLQTEYNNNALNNLYLVYAESMDSYDYVNMKSRWEIKMGCRKVYNLGFPRFDILRNDKRDIKKNISCFLWLPRWSNDSLYDRGNFLRYYKDIIEYFEKNKHLSLIIRPHPLMFNNYVDKKIMTEKEIADLKHRINSIENINFDINSDYIQTFKNSDALIADFSGLLGEYFVTGKPIIYCGDDQSFTSEIGKRIYKMFYISNTLEQLLKNIGILTAGDMNDLEDEREEIISGILGVGNDSANRIINSIKSNFNISLTE